MKLFNYKSATIEKLAFALFLCLTFVSTSFAQTGKGVLADQAAQVSEFEVSGLKVLVKRRPNAPTVAAGLFIRGGARNITDKNAGIENLMLEAATEGSKKYPRDVLRKELSHTGSSIGSGVNNDYSVISLVSTRPNFDRSWDVFTDVVMNPTFSAEDIAQAKEKIVTGLREQETDNDNFLQILQNRIIYANHPYANDVRGTIDTINSFSAKDLSDFHKKVMRTSQLLLVVVGDVDSKDLQNRVAATLGKLPRGDYKESPLPAIDFSKPTLDVTSRTLPTNYIQGVFNAPSLNSPDYSAMRVAMTVLQSRVFQEVRNKRQLSYAPNAELGSSLANTADIYVTTVDANQSISVMLNEIENLKRQPIDEDEISGIAGHFLTLYYLGQETNAAQAAELAKYELIGGGWRNAFDFLNKVRQVTPKEVQAVSNKYMKNIRFVVIGNPLAINKEVFLQK